MLKWLNIKDTGILIRIIDKNIPLLERIVVDILNNLKDTKIILASGSPRRKELLSKLGIKFNVRVSNIKEISTANTPEGIVEELSRQKTEAVVGDIVKENIENNICIVIGSDTAVFYDNNMLGKPKDSEEAYKMISVIQGRKHSVYSGVTVAIIKNNNVRYITFSERTEVKIAFMSKKEIECYILLGESLDKAGAYALQGPFSIFIESITGDYNNVIGLPLASLYKCLKGIELE